MPSTTSNLHHETVQCCMSPFRVNSLLVNPDLRLGNATLLCTDYSSFNTPRQRGTSIECGNFFLEIKNLEPEIHKLIAFSDGSIFLMSGHRNQHTYVFWGAENLCIIHEHEQLKSKCLVCINCYRCHRSIHLWMQYYHWSGILRYVVDAHSWQPSFPHQSDYFKLNGAPPHLAFTICA